MFASDQSKPTACGLLMKHQPVNFRVGATAINTAAIWSAVYGLIWATGQGFSTNFLMYGWQIVPYPTLSSHPLSSIWYLHIQPPLWNLLLGSVGRWSPLSTALSLQLLSLVLGALLAGFLGSLLVRVGVAHRCAVVLALFATLNPPVLRLAFDAQYELAVALGIVVVLWGVAAPMSTRPAHRFVVVSIVATSIVMTRSLYHPVWLALLLGPMVVAARRQVTRRALSAIVMIPVITVGGWMLKNEILFGQASLSTWTGMNLQKSVSTMFTDDELQQIADAGHISLVTVVGPFQPYANYASAVPPCSPIHLDPAVSLQQSTEPSVGIGGANFFTPNYNYECFIPLYDIAGDDAIYLSTHYPGRWLAGRAWSIRAWFSSGTMNERSSSIVLRALDNVYGAARLDLPAPVVSTDGWGSARAFLAPLGEDDVSWLLVGCSAIVLIGGASSLRSRVQRRPLDALAKVTVVAAFTLMWTLSVGVVGELGEQARFRTMTDPFVTALGIVVAARAAARVWRAKLARVDPFAIVVPERCLTEQGAESGPGPDTGSLGRS
jgi:hypothetical protein